MEHLKVRASDWKNVIKLKSCIQQELLKVDVNLDLGKMKSIEDDLDINILKDVLFKVDSSPVVYEAIFECLKDCTYRNEKITEDFFNVKENRELYYPIVIECLKVNIEPFFKSLASEFSKAFKKETTEKVHESKS